MKPKVCVYTICLNEIKFVERFVQHAKSADLIVVCDTGSTDGTPEKLRELGVTVHNIKIVPWRFDVARNTALSLIPSDVDICLTVDLDECLQPGWREALDRAWETSGGKATRFTYHYVWNWNQDNTPGISFTADRWHSRFGYIWRHPCHETVYPTGTEVRCDSGAHLHHHADNTKSRGQYLDLLTLSVSEDPTNDRVRYYYARELHFAGEYQRSIEELTKYLDQHPNAWDQERAAACQYISKNYENLGDPRTALTWALKGTQCCDYTREPWLALARAGYNAQDWHTCYWAIGKCLNITVSNTSYIADNSAWGCEPYDLGALSAYNLGLYQAAVTWGEIAHNLNPQDVRLLTNLQHYKNKLETNP